MFKSINPSNGKVLNEYTAFSSGQILSLINGHGSFDCCFKQRILLFIVDIYFIATFVFMF